MHGCTIATNTHPGSPSDGCWGTHPSTSLFSLVPVLQQIKDNVSEMELSKYFLILCCRKPDVFRRGEQLQLPVTVIDTPGALKSRFSVLLLFFFFLLESFFFFFFFLLVFAKESEGCKRMTGTGGMKLLIYYLLLKEIIYRGEIDRDVHIYLPSCHSFIFCLWPHYTA